MEELELIKEAISRAKYGKRRHAYTPEIKEAITSYIDYEKDTKSISSICKDLGIDITYYYLFKKDPLVKFRLETT